MYRFYTIEYSVTGVKRKGEQWFFTKHKSWDGVGVSGNNDRPSKSQLRVLVLSACRVSVECPSSEIGPSSDTCSL